MARLMGIVREAGAADPFPVPAAIDMRQACLKLLQENRLFDVEAYIAMQSPAARIEWQRAKELRRDHPLVGIMALFWGMTSERMDQWFREAAAIGPTRA